MKTAKIIISILYIIISVIIAGIQTLYKKFVKGIVRIFRILFPVKAKVIEKPYQYPIKVTAYKKPSSIMMTLPIKQKVRNRQKQLEARRQRRYNLINNY